MIPTPVVRGTVHRGMKNPLTDATIKDIRNLKENQVQIGVRNVNDSIEPLGIGSFQVAKGMGLLDNLLNTKVPVVVRKVTMVDYISFKSIIIT